MSFLLYGRSLVDHLEMLNGKSYWHFCSSFGMKKRSLEFLQDRSLENHDLSQKP